jgi:hypothetical protein
MKKLTFLLGILTSNLFSQEWNPVTPAAAPAAAIYRTGKVGIGTFYYPGATGQWYGTGFAPAFEVHSNDALGGTINNNALMVSFSGQGTNRIRHNTWLRRNSTGSSNWWNVNMHDGISVDNSFVTPGTDTKTWWERDAFQDIQYWGNAATTHMGLYQGRLGINRTTPLARLDVEETNASYMTFIARSNHTVDYKTCIYSAVSRDLTQAILVGNQNYGGTANNWKGTFLVYGNGQTIINTGVADAFMVKDLSNNINFKVKSNGQTKIGKLTQLTGSHVNAMLTVNGKIVGKEVVVTQQNWADFVFDKTYKLMPLSELENFYTTKHHLPQIPSSREIIEEGNDLGKTDALLLQKIEELTLYIVEQQKQIDSLKQKIEK